MQTQDSRPALAIGGRVAPIVPQDIEQVFRLARAVDAARWAPRSYLIDPRKPEAGYDVNRIVLGIMHGLELGLTPIAALQSIAVINGIPSIYGDGALAIVQGSGLLLDFREEPIVDAGNKVVGYTCTCMRRGIESPIWATFTLEDAKAAGLLSKPGPWQEYRARMLQMRARAWALRAGFADVLRGVSFAEEAQDVIDVTPTPAKAKPKTSAKAALDAFANEPPTHREESDGSPEVPDPAEAGV